MKYFYSPEQQFLFTNRQRELAALEYYNRNFINRQAEHIALFGLRRIGKTLLLKEFMRRLLENNDFSKIAFLDFSVLCSSPENFALGYLGTLCYWFIEEGKTDPEPYLNPNSLSYALLRSGNEKLLEEIQPVIQELQRVRPDRQILLRKALHFPRAAASILGKRVVLICDEFQEIRTLENYPNGRNVLALFRSELQLQSEVQYILAGSAISVLAGLFSNPNSPLFAQFTRMTIDSFEREGTRELVNKILAEPLDADFYPLIHSLTGGNPFYITAVARQLGYLIDVIQRPTSSDLIKQAFLIETLSPGGRIYDFCQYIYDLSLQKAKGYGALKSVLQILSQEEGLTASQMAQQLRVTSATASDYLRWLCEVDLLIEKEKKYYYYDAVLRFWVGNVIRGVEVSLSAESLALKTLISRLDSQFQRVAEELGEAQESLVRELMRHFHGQQVPGKLFNTSSEIVTLPKFVDVVSKMSANGQVEIDAYAEGDERWVAEVKWRNKRVGVKEIQKFMKISDIFTAKGWYISRAGFTADALQYASENGVLLTDGSGLSTLRRMIGVIHS